MVTPKIEPSDNNSEDLCEEDRSVCVSYIGASSTPSSTQLYGASIQNTKNQNKSKNAGEVTAGKMKQLTGYVLYSSQIRRTVSQNNPLSSFGEISRIVGSQWMRLPDAEKNVWKEKAQRINGKIQSKQELREQSSTPSAMDLQSSDMWKCQWDNCDSLFKEQAACVEHAIGHVTSYFAEIPITEVKYQCYWNGCLRLERGANPFVDLKGLKRHVKEVHIMKCTGCVVPQSECTTDFKCHRIPVHPLPENQNDTTERIIKNEPEFISCDEPEFIICDEPDTHASFNFYKPDAANPIETEPDLLKCFLEKVKSVSFDYDGSKNIDIGIKCELKENEGEEEVLCEPELDITEDPLDDVNNIAIIELDDKQIRDKMFVNNFDLENESPNKDNNNFTRLYECKICEKFCRTENILKNHIKKFHKNLRTPTHKKCKLCEKRFYTKQQLHKHIRIHNNLQINTNEEKKFQCENCVKQFTRKADVSRHMKIHTKEKYSCTVCSKVFNSAKSLNKHVPIHTKKFFCQFCPRKFTRKDNLDYHIRTHSEEKSFSCATCSKEFCSIGSLKRHILLHWDEKPFLCQFCPQKFSSKNGLDYHMLKTHSEVKPFTCKVCSKGFVTVIRLNQHLLIHSDEKEGLYQCKVCSKKFRSADNLDKHAAIHLKRFLCHLCPREFASNSSLNYHMKTHSEEKPFCCTICSKRFIDVGGYNRHAETHSDKKRYSCDYCSKGFTEKNNLIAHIRHHHTVEAPTPKDLVEKPFACTICPKRFRYACYLNRHTRIHADIKNFSCKYCSKGFTEKHNFIYHIRTHTGVNPYPCAVCSKGFRSVGLLNKHVIVHGEVKFSCHVCRQKFIKKSHLIRHIRSHSGETTTTGDGRFLSEGFIKNKNLNGHITTL